MHKMASLPEHCNDDIFSYNLHIGKTEALKPIEFECVLIYYYAVGYIINTNYVCIDF